MSPEWRKINLICSLEGGQVTLTRQPLPPMRADLIALFDRDELTKYMTAEELAGVPGGEAAAAGQETH
jgi:succinate dehydrogenase / fumarate reductase flavoprotein subunit